MLINFKLMIHLDTVKRPILRFYSAKSYDLLFYGTMILTLVGMVLITIPKCNSQSVGFKNSTLNDHSDLQAISSDLRNGNLSIRDTSIKEDYLKPASLDSSVRKEGVVQTQSNEPSAEIPSSSNQEKLNHFWVLIAAALVFFMQAGFKAFEVGLVDRSKESKVDMKNLLDWLVVTITLFLLGFSLLFGS